MTAVEKAKELVDKYRIIIDYDFISDINWHNPTDFNRNIRVKKDAKRCALIAVDEMIIQNGELYLNNLGEETILYYKKVNNYLFEVKQEIEKL